MSQEPLSHSDIEKLAELLARSKKPEILGRALLCRRIGIDPKTIGFIRQADDHCFALELINHLNDIDDREALCKLGNEIYFTFSKGRFAPELATILTKLNCNPGLRENRLNNQPVEQPTFSSESSPNFPHQPYRTQPQSWLSILGNAKNKLLAGGAILLIGLAGAGLQIYRQKTEPYAKLGNLLSAKQWKDADHETAQKMWEVADRLQERSLRVEDFEKIPCEDLRTIDALWKKYSKEHFGFSVQSRIWQSSDVNADLGKFVARVRWGQLENNGSSFHYYYMDGIPFELSQPAGHLPWAPTYYGGNSVTRKKYMSKLVECFPNP